MKWRRTLSRQSCPAQQDFFYALERLALVWHSFFKQLSDGKAYKEASSNTNDQGRSEETWWNNGFEGWWPGQVLWLVAISAIHYIITLQTVLFVWCLHIKNSANSLPVITICYYCLLGQSLGRRNSLFVVLFGTTVFNLGAALTVVAPPRCHEQKIGQSVQIFQHVGIANTQIDQRNDRPFRSARHSATYV